MKRRVPSVLLRFVVVGHDRTWDHISPQVAGRGGRYRCERRGYSLGLAASFLFNRNWTFYHSGAWLPALARFLCTDNAIMDVP
jgi:hypothetical protein